MKASFHYLKFMTCTLLILPVISILNLQAQDTEYKDAPYFPGMPNYIIDYAEDIEFDSTRFFNGTNCPIVEGEKFLRLYVLKEGATQASIIQILRNYATAFRSMGGTVLFEGVHQSAECPDYNDLHMMVGKVIKDGNEVWVEVRPEGNGNYYRLTEVIRKVMKQDITATDMVEANIPDSHIALPVGDINLNKSVYPREVKGDGNEVGVEVLPNVDRYHLTNVKDIEGNVYGTVLIGNQKWMAENLKTTHYKDGTVIPGFFADEDPYIEQDDRRWSNLTTDAYCWFRDDPVYKNLYGALYNFYAVKTDKLCPAGWHVPTKDEWEDLLLYLGGRWYAGGKLKEAGPANWLMPNEGATNESGFTAIGSGMRWDDQMGHGAKFSMKNRYGCYWSSSTWHTLAWVLELTYDRSDTYLSEYDQRTAASIRCLQDKYTLR